MNIQSRKFKRFVGIFCLLASLFCGIQLQAQTANPPAKTSIHSKNWAQMTAMEKTQFVCLAFAVICVFVAEIWFIVAGFQASIGWGLFMLFIGGFRSVGAAICLIAWIIHWSLATQAPEMLNAFRLPILIGTAFTIFAGIGAIIFFIRHWQHARKPLFVMMFGMLLIAAAVGLEFTK